MQLDVWFNRITFFLASEYSPSISEDKMPEPKVFNINIREFTFECADSQIIKAKGKTFYNLESRLWKYHENLFYDIKTILHEGDTLTVFFTIRNEQQKIVDTFKKMYRIDTSFIVNPIHSDYQPRQYAMDCFQEMGFDKTQTERFFRTCYLLCLQKVYNEDPSALCDGRKPVNQGLLDRLLDQMSKMFSSKIYSSIYDEFPICAMDQNIARLDKPQDAVGNILVLLRFKKPKNGILFDEFRW